MLTGEQSSIAEELRGVSKYLPALMRAEKIQKKAEKAGYKFENEINLSVISDDVAEAESAPERDCGQLLFAAVNFAAEPVWIRNWLSLLILRSFTDEFEKFENREN